MENALIFLRAAAPWISLGLMIAFFCVRPAVSKSKKENSGGDHAVEGMCVGMCAGMALGSMIGDGNGGLGTSLGMLIGLAVGLCIRRKNGGAPLPSGKEQERKETHGE